MIEFCNSILLGFTMTFMDLVAIYGAGVATTVAVWDIVKWRKAQARVTLSCYLAKMVDNMVVPSGARLYNGTSDEQDRQRPRFIAYDIKNTGGTPITTQSLGGRYRDGKLFVISGHTLLLPQTIQTGASLLVPMPLGETPEAIQIQEFHVNDAVGREWRCKALGFQKQLAAYRQMSLPGAPQARERT